MNLLTTVALLLLLPTNAEWEGCGLDADKKIVSGEKSAICIVLSGPDNWRSNSEQKYARTMFTPEVDSFAKLTIANSWSGKRGDDKDLLLKNYTTPSVHVESGKSVSYIKRYRGLLDDSSNTAVTWPYMTAIINVDKGVITGITWDDGCYFCEEGSCSHNTYDFEGNQVVDDSLSGENCHVLDSDCMDAESRVAENCPLQVYAVWTGTDVNGKYLKSAEMRFSQYKSYSVMDFIKNTKDKYKEATDFTSRYTGGN